MSISQQIENYTAAKSKFETSRDYISISHASLSVNELVSTFLNGFTDSHEIRLRCYKGYQMEADLKDRIQKCLPVIDGGEIVAHNGLVKGHPDFRYDFVNHYPGDCKSVPLDEYLPEPGRLPKKAFWQMQGYMHFDKKDRALIIYESRETGRIRDFWLMPVKPIQQQIDAKYCEVVQTVNAFLNSK